MAEQYTRIVTLTLLAAAGWLPFVCSCIPFPGEVAATATRPGSSLATPTGSTPPTAACRTIGAYARACASTICWDWPQTRHSSHSRRKYGAFAGDRWWNRYLHCF